MEQEPNQKLRGLGDLIEAVAKPIARAIDAIAGTDIEHCEGCESRRQAANRLVPFNSPVPAQDGGITGDPAPPAITPCLNCGRK